MRKNNKNSYTLKIRIPEIYNLHYCRQFGKTLNLIAPIFHCVGILDWQVNIRDTKKILAKESEFIDLEKLAKEKRTYELWFYEKKFSLACRKILQKKFPRLHFSAVLKQKQKDWLREWKKSYKPIRYGKNGDTLWIIPSWEQKLSRFIKYPYIKIHPGLAFGTGTHPTTSLCIEAFLNNVKNIRHRKQLRILDFGAGTGILGFSAYTWAKKNNLSCILKAIEIDPEAIKNFKKNAILNKIPNSISKRFPKYFQADIVFANILSPIILENKKLLLDSLAKNGYLIISGILKNESSNFLKKFLKDLPKKNSLRYKKLYCKEWFAIQIQKTTPQE